MVPQHPSESPRRVGAIEEESSPVDCEPQDRDHQQERADEDVATLLSSADIAMLLLDTQMRVEFFTPATARLLSLIDADLGRPIGDFPARLASEGLVDDAQHVLAQLEPVEREVWSGGADPRCHLRRVVPYRTSRRKVEGVIVTLLDITTLRRNADELERRVAEQTVESGAARQRLQSIIDSALDAIVTIDQAGVVQLVNPATETMFGYTAAEIVGRNVKLLMPSPQAELHDDYLAAYQSTGEPRVIGIGREVSGRRKDGTVFSLDLSLAEVRMEDSVTYVGTMRDLTQLKQAQEGLLREHALSRAIVSTARAIILRLDERGRILSFNPYMEELCGYSLEEVRGKDWFTTFIPERDRERIRALYGRATRGQRPQGNINAITTKSGEELLVEWYDEVLEVPGEPFSLLAIGHDVTARHQLQQEFLQAQKMEAVGRLAAGVAHDFNNLLAGIIGGIGIAFKDLGSEHPGRQTLEQVLAETKRGSAITRRLLDFSRIGKPKPDLVNPCETLHAVERMIRRLIGEDIEVELVCESRRSRFLADLGQIEQAILNLAINARDAMPRGGRLGIECRDAVLSGEDARRVGASPEPQAYVVLSVTDSGCGMDETTRRRALEPFFTTKAPGQGTGLGLSSVASMMEHCRGHLSLESEPGVGTTVRMLFPRVAGDAPLAVAATPAPEAELPGAGETILVVEDETLVRLGVQHVLEELGYVTLAARDPEQALKEFEGRDEAIDLLLSDVVLPGMSGPELAARVLEKYRSVRILYMSAFPTDELVAQGRIAAGTPTLEKPFSNEELRSKVREALDGRARHHPAGSG